MKWLPSCVAAAALFFGAAPARAEPAPPGQPGALLSDPSTPTYADGPEYFNGIGTSHRAWQFQSDTAFGTARVFTQRLEIARAFELLTHLDLVVRVDVAADDATRARVSAIQGPIASVGVRNRNVTNDYFVEFGLRLVPPWGAPDDQQPQAIALALDATLTSGLADDARWLSFADFGVQIYGLIQARTAPYKLGTTTELVAGLLYGGAASLTPMNVRSWLGPQSAFIGNAFAEAFLGVPRFANAKVALQLGAHADVSLSSIWPAGEPFPVAVTGFVGWSPTFWFAGRLFVGAALSPDSKTLKTFMPYGLRAEFYVP